MVPSNPRCSNTPTFQASTIRVSMGVQHDITRNVKAAAIRDTPSRHFGSTNKRHMDVILCTSYARCLNPSGGLQLCRPPESCPSAEREAHCDRSYGLRHVGLRLTACRHDD